MCFLNTFDSATMQVFQISPLTLSYIANAYFLGNLLFLIPAGILLDRLNTKNLFLLQMFVSLACSFLFYFSHSWVIGLFIKFIAGVSGGAFSFIICLRIASRLLKYQQIPLASGLLITCGMAGGLFAQLPLLKLAESWGPRGALEFVFVIGIFFLLANAFLLPNNLDTQSQHSEFSTANVRHSLFNRYTWLGGFLVLVLDMPVAIMGTLWGYYIFHNYKAVSTINTSYAITSLFFGVIIGSLTYGKKPISLNTFPKKVFLACITTSIFLLVFAIFNLPLPIYCLLFGLIGFISGAQVYGYWLVISFNAPQNTSLATSICSIIIMGGGALLRTLIILIFTKAPLLKYINSMPINLNQFAFLCGMGFILSIYLVCGILFKKIHVNDLPAQN